MHYDYAELLRTELYEPKEAQEHYEQALSLVPDFADFDAAHADYAKLLQDELDAPEEAKAHYERALDIEPDFTAAHENLHTLCDTN